jgi:hypothetical protein
MTTYSPSAAAILADLAVLGIELEARGDTIRYRPRFAMTAPVLEQLQRHKSELIMVLRSSPREQAQAILDEAHDRALRLSEAWEERLSIVTADGIPLAEAERTALLQLRMMQYVNVTT